MLAFSKLNFAFGFRLCLMVFLTPMIVGCNPSVDSGSNEANAKHHVEKDINMASADINFYPGSEQNTVGRIMPDKAGEGKWQLFAKDKYSHYYLNAQSHWSTPDLKMQRIGFKRRFFKPQNYESPFKAENSQACSRGLRQAFCRISCRIVD